MNKSFLEIGFKFISTTYESISVIKNRQDFKVPSNKIIQYITGLFTLQTNLKTILTNKSVHKYISICRHDTHLRFNIHSFTVFLRFHFNCIFQFNKIAIPV